MFVYCLSVVCAMQLAMEQGALRDCIPIHNNLIRWKLEYSPHTTLLNICCKRENIHTIPYSALGIFSESGYPFSWPAGWSKNTVTFKISLTYWKVHTRHLNYKYINWGEWTISKGLILKWKKMCLYFIYICNVNPLCRMIKKKSMLPKHI